MGLLIGAIRSLTGFESLSPHYWRLLGKLTALIKSSPLHDVEVMRSLEEAEDCEKLEAWMAAVW